MKERLELWVLRSAVDTTDPSPLWGLLHLAQAAEEIGDAAQAIVWLVENGEEIHPVLAYAVGERRGHRAGAGGPGAGCGSRPVTPLIASGPDEGHSRLAELCGFRLVGDDEMGEIELIPVSSTASRGA
jgi:hypothetical protein